ncbi:hypothetical protein [Patulibacter sp.]|uniref:hypothetical protein n=1 Tax=Patulibacter sp. TaxID=1912859 RepID=UPI00271B884C|nr:hypothetical protein [Patulibacter sp.]MDO9409696.1 hypothetical protein [Patulibacter sp.]
MSKLFFLTGVDGVAKVNLEATVVNPVSAGDIAMIGGATAGLLDVTVPAADVRCWGVKPARQGAWDSIQPGDVGLIYTASKKFGYWATVLDKVDDPLTATSLWGTDASDGAAWSLMFFLEVTAFSAPVDLAGVQTALGHGTGWFPQGFGFASEAAQSSFAQGFGALDEAVLSLDSGAVAPGGPVPIAGGVVPVMEQPFDFAGQKLITLSGASSASNPEVVGDTLNKHRTTLLALAKAAQAKNYDPVEPKKPAPNYDIKWNDGTHVWIAEVKGITAQNETTQLRLALGELLEFLHRQKTLNLKYGINVPFKGAIVTSDVPSVADRWRDVCTAYGIVLVCGTSASELNLAGL